MSKYKLTDIHKGIIKEGMGRGGTIKDSFRGIATVADEIEGQNLGIDTFPIEVKRLGPDDQTNEEFAIRYGDDKDEVFHIYDYKFGEDPTSEENAEEEYPFSLGIPLGNKTAKKWAAKLGFAVEGMTEAPKYYEDDNRVDSPVEKETEKMRFKEDHGPKHADGTPKSNDEMTDDEREDYYNDLDSMDESKEDLDESPNLEALAKKLGMSVKDLEAKVAKFQSAESGAMDSRAKMSVAEEEEKHLKEHFQRFLKDYQ
jgi:hypothetical protein